MILMNWHDNDFETPGHNMVKELGGGMHFAFKHSDGASYMGFCLKYALLHRSITHQ
jgi:hypothetical protein